MKGRYLIKIENNRLHYTLALERNITIIQGNSGTGKTTLVSMVNDYIMGDDSISCSISQDDNKNNVPVNIGVISPSDKFWKLQIQQEKNSIMFMDEDCRFVKTKEFAETVKNSDCYFVIITRDSLPMLPYSIEEIYTMVEDKKYPKLKKTYNKLVRKYNDKQKPLKPDLVLTEDSCSGFQFVKESFNSINCNTCCGKSNVAILLNFSQANKVLLVVDGAAFGSDIEATVAAVKERNRLGKQTSIFAPESFEWLILRSKNFYALVKNELERTYDYADSSQFESWEQYYTSLLINLTKDKISAYSKTKLNPYYLQGKVQEEIKKMYSVIEDDMKPLDLFN